MPVQSWLESDEWDRLELGGVPMPGVARVEVKLPSSIDRQKPKGGKKARLKDVGSQPAELSIELELQDDELPEFEREAIPILRSRKAGASLEKLSISHPQARMWGIAQVKVGKISSPMPRTGGTYTVHIEAWEHVDVPKVAKPPKEVAEGDWAKQTNDAVSALKQSPAQTGAAEDNFTSADQPLGSGF